MHPTLEVDPEKLIKMIEPEIIPNFSFFYNHLLYMSCLLPPSNLQPSKLTNFDFPLKKLSQAAKQKANNALVKLFFQNFQSYLFLEDKGLRSFIHVLNSSYELPSIRTISKTIIPAKYEEVLLRTNSICN